MKIDFATEIGKCFQEQYSEKEKAYMRIFGGDWDIVFEDLKVYDEMVENLSFLIKLIVKLKNKNK